MNYILTKHENRASAQNWLSRSQLFKPPLFLMGLLCSLLFLSSTTVKAQNPLWGIKDYTNLGYFSNTTTYPWTWTSWATLSGGNYCATASLQSDKGIIFNQTTRVFHLVNTSTGALTAMTITNSGSIPRNLNYNVAAYDPVSNRLFIANENDRYGHIFTVNIASNSVTYVSEKDFAQALNSDDWAFIDGKVIGLDHGTVETWVIATNTYTEQSHSGPSTGEVQGAWTNSDGTIGFYGESNNIYKFNPTTNTTTLLGISSTSFSNGGEPHDMAQLGIGVSVSPLTWGVNNPYTGAVAGADGITPYTYAITAGSLPTGLSLNTSTGAITGTPSVIGSFPVTFQVTDATTPTSLVATSTVTFTIGTDTDGDSILDFTDIDDDNDGILDKLEYQCPTFATWTDWASLTAYSSATGSLALTGGNVNVTYTSSQVISIQGISGSYFNLGDAYAGTMPASGIEGLQAHHGAGVTHTYTFSQPVKDPILVFWSMNSNTFSFTQPFTILGQQGGVTSTATTVVGAAGECNTAVQLSGTFTSISYTSTILEGWTGVTVGVQQCNYDLDSDNDGTVNAKDLDSDNDGCSDAYEGGATTDKATPNFKFNTAVGTNGLANSLETVTDNGTINYSPAYTSFAMDAVKSRCLLKAPGGVPGANVWLKADAGTNTTTTGVGVSAWANQGESGGTAGQFMSCTLPTFTNNKHNFNPSITDNSTACAGALKLENVFGNTAHRDLTTFTVKSLPDVTVQRMIHVFTPNTAYGSDYEWPWSATENANTSWFWWSHNYANTTTFANNSRKNNTPWIDGYSLPKFTSGTHTTTRYLDGATATHSGGVNPAYGIGHNLFINADATGDNPSGGDLSEMVAYDRILSATETDQVQSYLAVKYGKTLLNAAGTATKDYLNSLGTKVWDIAANANYNNNIVGIARDTNSDLHQKQSRSVNTGFQPIIGIGTTIATTNAANTNNFATGIHYEMMGDNGLSSNYSVTYAPSTFSPPSGFYRMPRIWKVQETGTVGMVTISVPVGVERLLVSNTNAFTPGVGTQEIEMTADGSGNVTAQVDFTDGQFFSFGRAAIGPGGVTAMAWWFEGDKGVTTSGSAVTEWEDQSLNGLNVTQTTVAKQPAATSFQNFNPIVTYTGNKALNNAAGYWKNSTNNAQYNVFAVAKHTTGTGSVNPLFTENTNLSHQVLFMEYGGNMYMGTWGSYSAYTPYTAATYSGMPILVGSRYSTTGPVKQLYKNGRAQTMTGYNNGMNVGAFNGNNSNLVIGNHTDQGSWPYEGDIAEMVMYPTDLSAGQRQQVESYLALKWGMSLDQTTAYNYVNSAGATIWDATANSTYKNNIFGIGTDAAAGLSQKQSKSVNTGVQPVFGLGSIAATNAANTASFSADKSFMIAGSDAGVAKFFTAITAPAGNEANNRFTRIWKVQETGTVGTVQFAIPSYISGGNTIYLVRSTDATFDANDTWTPLSTNLTINNMAHAAATVDFSNGDYFTVATYVGSPGCVAANLNFWLKADAIGEEDGASLAEWENQANTSLDSVGQATVGARPVFYETNEANLVNFNPSVSFDGGDELTQNARMFPQTSAFTQIALAVDRRTNAGELRAPMGGGFGNGNAIGLDFQTDGVSPNGWNPYSGIDAEWGNTTATYRLNSLGLGATNTSGNIVGVTSNNVAAGSNNVISYVNGAKDLTTISANQNAIFGNGMYVGSSADANWLGLVPEVIVYDKQLSDAEMQRVYSYLAIKYGATLKQSYVNSTGTTIYDTTGYANNIAGIGREICQTLHQKQSRSMLAGFQPTIGLTSITTTNTANNAALTDGTFMIWGSDAGAASFGTPITAPAGSTANNRFSRIWKVQETGTVGTVQFAVPQVGQGNTVYLVRSTNATFDATDTWIPLSNLTVGSTTYLAGDIDFANGDYFTIATYITAPGCVADLKIWVKGDAGIAVADGSSVSTWSDVSGNDYHMTQPTAGNQPKYYKTTASKLINFNPTLDFNGSQFIGNRTRLMPNTSQYTFLGVGIDEDNGTGYRGLFSSQTNVDYLILYKQGGATGNNGWRPYSVGNIDMGKGTKYSPTASGSNGYWNGTNYTQDASVYQTQPSIAGFSSKNSIAADPFNTWVDGWKDNPTGKPTVQRTQYFGAFGVGADYDENGSGPEAWLGRIPEVLAYNRELTDLEMQRVNSYLAIKYGVTLGQGNGHVGINGNNYNYLSGAGTVIWDATANSTYRGNIAGIGRDSCQALEQKQSKSAQTGFQPIIGLARIDSTNAINPSVFAADKSFMLWGNDNGPASLSTTITAPASARANNRMTRIWKVQETGTVGTVKFAIPQVGQGSAVYLVRSTDATFDAADTWTELFNYTIGSTSYLAGDIDFNNGDYFTVATMVVGPGGVVDSDFWVKSDDAGAIATAWKDHSKNSNPIEAVGTWNLSTADAAHNFHPYTTGFTSSQYFKDEGSSLTLDNTYGTQTRTPYTVFSAVKPNGPTGRIIGIDNDELYAAEPGFSIQNLKPYFYEYYETAGSDVHTQAIASGSTSVLSFNAQQLAANSCNMRMGKDGIYENFTRAGYFHNLGENLVLGYGTWDINAAFPGDIMEIAWYKRDLSTNEQDRVNSYLGIKNGVTLSINYLSAASTVIWNRSTSTGFNNNIFGIGRDDASALNQKQAKSTHTGARLTTGLQDSIAPNNALHPSGFNQDAAFLMVGDNAATGTTAFAAGATCAPPPVVDKFTNLYYKIVETGTVQSIKVQFDASGLGFNNSFPVFMQVASDAAFSNMIANVPMKWTGGSVQTNYDFAANAATYIRFAGNSTPLANLCEGDKTIDWWWHKNKWDWGQRSKTIVDGDQTFTATITDAGNNILHPTWYPVSHGNSIYIPRYDKDNTGKVVFKITMSKPSSNVSFPIYGVDAHWGLDKIKVIGTLSGGSVTPKLSKAKYSWVNISGDQAQGREHHYAGYSHWGVTYVNFDSPVDEITVEYTKTTTYPNWKIYNYIGIGAFDITCQTPVPEAPTPDNVYLFKQVKAASNKANEEFTYKFTIQNNNCNDRTISLTDNLPSSLTWIDSSLVSSAVIGSENAYGGTAALSLSNITVPPGTSYIYVNAKGTTAGTYSGQATMTITGGGTHSSDDPSVSGASNPTVVTVTPPAPTANLAITKAVNKTTTEQNTEVTYTFNITNNGSSAVNTLFEDNLRGEAVYVAGSLTGAPAGTQVSAYAGEGTLGIRDLNIAAGATVTMTIRANVGTTPVDSLLTNMAQVTPDIASGYRQATTQSNTVQTRIVVGCNAGTATPTLSATTSSNACPTTKANLGSITASNLPVGIRLTWHTATPATMANKVADSSQIAASGTYYAAFTDFVNGCIGNSGNATTAVTVTLTLCTTTPSVTTPTAGGSTSGNAATELNPTGGTAPYTYSNGSSDPACTAPVGASPLPANSNLVVNSNGTYSYTTPTTIGTYYFCIKVCDNSSPTPICKVQTYTVNVACGSGTVAPSLSTTNASNTCPALTVNLSGITATNLPSGAKLTWHTATPATLVNKVADSTAVVAGLTYYASFYDFANGCFGGSGANTTAVTTTSTNCSVVVRSSIKAFLSGSYVSAAGLMHDSLRVKNLIPTAQPYATMGHTGTETVNPSVLATTGNNAIVDWVLVELRSAPNVTVAKRAALIQRDGDIVDTDGTSSLSFSAAAGSYHIVVRHRNHLGVMTASTVALTATTTAVDFTVSTTALYQRTDAFANTNATRAYGSVRALWGGNASGNANIIATGGSSDGSATLLKVLLDSGNAATSSPSFIIYNQYQREDVNMDGKTVYQGSSNELSTILLNILNHPSNIGFVTTYIIYEQLP